jgi:hypothetical protein
MIISASRFNVHQCKPNKSPNGFTHESPGLNDGVENVQSTAGKAQARYQSPAGRTVGR